MNQNFNLRLAVLCLAGMLLSCFAGKTQIVAGIRANGKILVHGDTINVCRGSSIVYQSLAQGSLNIFWRFTGGSTETAEGIGPFSVTYNTNGYDTTFQKVAAGVFADSMFIIVRVSSVKPVAGFNFSTDNVCGNESIQFNNTSITGKPHIYDWSFNDGTGSISENPSHQFLTAVGLPGTQPFVVRLVITNVNGCVDSIKQIVTVKKVPDASIGNADPEVNFGTFNDISTFKKCNNIPFYTFKFTNQSTTITNNVSYTIQWGDGKPDSVFTNWPAGTIIKHTFPLGSSTMTVNVNGPDGCIGIKKYNVFIGTIPAGGLANLGNSDICSSDSLRFAITNINNNPPGTSYSFTINDGSDAQIFQHAPPAIVGHYFKYGSCSFTSNNGAQSYTNAFGAFLTIENPCGSNSASVLPIYVSGKPRPSIYIPSPVICVNNTITISNTSSYGNVVTPTGTFSSTCENKGKKVWVISPSTGYTILSGKLGSLNGNNTNGLLWTEGSNSLNVRFTAIGMYKLKIYIFNDRCGMDSTTETICVRNSPNASFSMNQPNSCGPVTVDITNTSSVGGCQGDNYKWDVEYSDPGECAQPGAATWAFAKNTKTSSKSPSFLFTASGRYIIKLTVNATNSLNSCEDAIAIDTFYVKAPPKATIAAAINTICVNNSIKPSAIVSGCYSTGPYGYQWKFVNGSPAMSTELIPGNISYPSTGVHSIQLIVTDSSCMLADTVNTTVKIVPLPDAEAGNDVAVCSGETVSLGATGVAGVAYKWNPEIGLNNPSIANPIATLSYAGSSMDTVYTYFVNASLGANCSSIDSVKITVKRNPVVSVNSVSIQICLGNNTLLNAFGADNYSWSPAAGLNSTTHAGATASPSTTTVYTVKGTAANGCSDQQTVTVNVVPHTKAGFIAPDTVKCSPLNINSLITVNPFEEGNGTYNWYANDKLIGSNSTGDVPSYSITQPGQAVIIKLVTLSASGCKADSMQKTFMAVPSATAGFTKDRDSSCAPMTVSFTNTSTIRNNIGFSWDFGNGITSDVAQPDAISFSASPFFRDTVYHIVLKATNGCDTTYFKDSVKVLANAKARFAVDSTRGCSPFTFSIINTSLGNIGSYYWDFGDGKTDTTHSLGAFEHTYYTGNITTYTIRLIAENSCTRDTQLLNIVVSPNDINPFITAYGDQLKGCAPHQVIFNNSTIGASEITWNFGDNTPPVFTSNIQGSISHQYANAGNYKVIIRLKNDCSDTTIERTVVVYESPIANFDVSPEQICAGQPVTVTNQSVNANAYEWVWDDGTTSAFINGRHDYDNTGIFNIKLIAQSVHSSGFVCTDTVVKQVKVVNKIPAQINVAPGNTCVPYTLKADAVNTVGASLIEWVIYDSSAAQKEFHFNGPTASYVYNEGGTYSVRLVVHTTAGCTDTATYLFEVFNTPHIEFEKQLIITCEHDTTVNFDATTTHAGNDPVNYKWFINDRIEGTKSSFSFQFRAPFNNTDLEEFTVKVLAQNNAGCGDTSQMSKVIIQPLPVATIRVSPSLILQQPDYEFTFKDIADTNPQKNYLWDMGDKSLQTRTGQQVTYQYGDTGTYNVKLLVTDFSTGCKAMDSVKVAILHVPGYLQVPNAMCPGCSNFSLRQFLPLGKGLKKYRLSIYTTWGQKIFETTSLNADGSPNVAWDGTFNGKPLQQDAYSWQIEAIYINETEWKGMVYPGSSKAIKAGFITIIK